MKISSYQLGNVLLIKIAALLNLQYENLEYRDFFTWFSNLKIPNPKPAGSLFSTNSIIQYLRMFLFYLLVVYSTNFLREDDKNNSH